MSLAGISIFFYDFTTEVDIIFLYYLYGENSIKKVLRTCKQQSVAWFFFCFPIEFLWILRPNLVVSNEVIVNLEFQILSKICT